MSFVNSKSNHHVQLVIPGKQHITTRLIFSKGFRRNVPILVFSFKNPLSYYRILLLVVYKAALRSLDNKALMWSLMMATIGCTTRTIDHLSVWTDNHGWRKDIENKKTSQSQSEVIQTHHVRPGRSGRASGAMALPLFSAKCSHTHKSHLPQIIINYSCTAATRTRNGMQWQARRADSTTSCCIMITSLC